MFIRLRPSRTGLAEAKPAITNNGFEYSTKIPPKWQELNVVLKSLTFFHP
jgi:hypothetical protein